MYMEHSTIALIIMALTLILFITEKLPLAVTAMLSAFAMAATGCISYDDAFAGFANTATLSVIGLSIIGESFFTTGLADKIGGLFLRNKNMTEKRFVLFVAVATALLSCLLNGLVVIAMFMPIIDSVAAKSEGRIQRKNVYLPAGIGAVFGGNLSNIGSSSMINASGQLAASYFGRPLRFLEPFPAGLAGTLVFIVLLAVFGTRLQHRFFDFEEEGTKLLALSKQQIKEMKTAEKVPAWKKWFVLGVLIVCMVFFILGYHLGAFALLGAMLCISFGCIRMEQAIRSVEWNTVFIVVGTLGFAKGVADSGAGQKIADVIMTYTGPLGQSDYAMCVVILFLATLISNFMSNNGAVGITMPIAMAISQAMGSNAIAFCLACAVGANLSVMTPICTSTITVTSVVGYRFKDFARFGGIFNILAFIATAGVLSFYF